MVLFNVYISGNEMGEYVNHYIRRYVFENYQPIKGLTDQQINAMINSLEAFLQTEIGTPNNYTIIASLAGINSETEVDDEEVITRAINNISVNIDIVPT